LSVMTSEDPALGSLILRLEVIWLKFRDSAKNIRRLNTTSTIGVRSKLKSLSSKSFVKFIF